MSLRPERSMPCRPRAKLSLIGHALLNLAVAATAACGDPAPGALPDTSGAGSPVLAADVQAALQRLSPGRPAQVVLVADNGVPEFVKGELGQVSGARRELSLEQAQVLLAPSLSLIAPVFRLTNEELHIRQLLPGPDGRLHVRMDQRKYGLPVVGGELVIHIDPQGAIYAVNGSAQGAPASPPDTAQTSPAAAVSTAVRMVYYRQPDASLVLAFEQIWDGVRDGVPAHDLVYLRVDNGALLGRRPQIQSIGAVRRDLFTAGGGTTLPGVEVRKEGGAATRDDVVNTNYDLLGATYNCYQSIFGYESFDGAGAIIPSTVHYDVNYNNAFANGAQVTFGDGDGREFSSLGSDPDVVVHEFSHLVTSRTSNLTYQGDSGALNESMSDVIATVCKSYARGFVVNDSLWRFAEESYTPGVLNDALRYMNNPTLDGYSKDYYPERLTGPSDNGGVHGNSGIANLAFSLLVAGGRHPRGKTPLTVDGIGILAASQIWFNAERFYLPSDATMPQARQYFMQAAEDSLAPKGIIDSVDAAWRAVGVR